MKTLTESDVTFAIECLPEHTPIEGNAMASGDDEADREAEQWIHRQLDNGNDWAWCTVRVTAEFEGLLGDDYLGCCSYKSEDDFKQPGGYYDDMKACALAELNAKLSRVCDKLS